MDVEENPPRKEGPRRVWPEVIVINERNKEVYIPIIVEGRGVGSLRSETHGIVGDNHGIIAEYTFIEKESSQK